MAAGTSERNFSNFYLEDNVYELAFGVIPQIAERLDVDLGPKPNRQALGELVGKIGPDKVLRKNKEIEIDRPMIGLVDQSKVQEPLSRSLWTPHIAVTGIKPQHIVITGSMANWQDRTAALLMKGKGPTRQIHMASGNRVMDEDTERDNPNVQIRLNLLGRFPTESEYAEAIIKPQLEEYGHIVTDKAYDTDDGDKIAAEFFKDNPGLFDGKLGFARVANAGIQLAVQMRRAAQVSNPDFDSDKEHPQVFVLTDGFPLAHNGEQEGEAHRYQKAATALRQLAITAKMLHEAAGGE
jgi:hypothetical protein